MFVRTHIRNHSQHPYDARGAHGVICVQAAQQHRGTCNGNASPSESDIYYTTPVRNTHTWIVDITSENLQRPINGIYAQTNILLIRPNEIYIMSPLPMLTNCLCIDIRDCIISNGYIVFRLFNLKKTLFTISTDTQYYFLHTCTRLYLSVLSD